MFSFFIIRNSVENVTRTLMFGLDECFEIVFEKNFLFKFSLNTFSQIDFSVIYQNSHKICAFMSWLFTRLSLLICCMMIFSYIKLWWNSLLMRLCQQSFKVFWIQVLTKRVTISMQLILSQDVTSPLFMCH